ncbi:MAG TPA: energy transducer TonB [Pyrinomonadaceae bacterium]|jgi:protein TonB|nr:energy transducer TonB [Pyrinomonadaceae bacterium]
MHVRRLHFALAILLLSALPLSAQVQKPADAWAEWETLSPENEEFTVLMPKNPTTETTKFPYHKMELSARLYLASSSAGPVIGVVSLSGIKSDPAQYTEFARFNSYVDAFKNFFPPKIRAKETMAKMVLVSSRPFRGYTGRSYKMTLGDLNGSVNAFVTKKRFYAIVSLNSKKDEALEEKFLSSFELPERPPDPPKTTAVNADGSVNTEDQTAGRKEAAPAEGEVALPPNGTEGNTEQNTSAGANTPNQQVPNPQRQKPKGPLAGGMLNSKALYMPTPEVPAGEASGVVLVQVLVDEQGTVIDARPVSGPQHLHAAAVNAARLARFPPTLVEGDPVKVSGTLSYNFARSN